MNLTWHLVKQDLRRFWPYALFLQVVLLAVGVIDWYSESMSVVVAGNFSKGLIIVMGGAGWISLIAAIVEADPVHGRPAFWMTRPISSRRLWVAKLLSVLLMAIVPQFIVHFIWSLSAGSTLVCTLDSVFRGALTVVTVAIPVMLFAALTGRVFRLWGLLLVGMLVLGIGQALLQSHLIEFSIPSDSEMQETWLIVRILLVGFGSLFALYHLYVSRAVLRVWFVGLGLLAAFVTVPCWFSWHMPKWIPDRPQITAPAGVIHWTQIAGGSGAKAMVTVFTNNTLEYTAKDDVGPLRISWIRGKVEWTEGSPDPIDVNVTTQNRMGCRTALASAIAPGVELLNPDEVDKSAVPFSVPVHGRNNGRLLCFRGQARFDRIRLLRVGEMPMQDGAMLHVDSAKLFLNQIIPKPGGVGLKIRQQVGVRSLTRSTAAENVIGDPVLVLYNRRLNQAAIAYGRDSKTSLNLTSYGVRISEFEVNFPIPGGKNGPAAWLKDATLLVLGEEALDWFSMPVEYEPGDPGKQPKGK